MRLLLCFPVLLIAAVLSCGGDDFSSGDDDGDGDGGAPPAPTATCADICSTRAELSCAGETPAKCEAECAYYAGLVRWCSAPADGLIECLAAEPTTSFGCDEVPGPLHIRDGVCPDATDGLLSCWYEGPPGGLPPEVPTGCQKLCDAQSALDCKSPTCVDDCLSLLDPTKSCDGAYGAFVDCAGSQPASSWQCGLDGKPELSGGACLEYYLVALGCVGGG